MTQAQTEFGTVELAELTSLLAQVNQEREVEKLFKLYRVSNVDDLVTAQAGHIKRLQAKLPATKFSNIRPPRKGKS